MKFDSFSRIVLVAAVASGFALTSQAQGKQAPARTHGSNATTRTLDGQRPPPPPKPDPKDKKHKRKGSKPPPPHRPPPPNKPPPKTPPGG